MAIDITTQQRFDMFASFAAQKGSTSTIVAASLDGKSISVKKTHDFIGNIGRLSGSRDVNNATRDLFKRTVLGMFGVTDEKALPASVRDVMKLEDYHEKGKPLTTRRILAVTKAVDAVFDARLQPLLDEAARKGVPVDDNVKAALRSALRAHTDDGDLLDVVKANIRGILMDGGNLRSADAIGQKVDAFGANLSELRQAANGDAQVLAVGKKCLAGLNGDSLGAGQFRTMLSAAEAGSQRMAPIVAELPKPSNPRNLGRLIRDFSMTLDEMLADCNQPGIRLDGPNRETSCRNFLVGVMLQKCGGKAVLDKLQSELDRSGGALKKWCQTLVPQLQKKNIYECPVPGAKTLFMSRTAPLPHGERKYLAGRLEDHMTRLDQLKAALEWTRGVPYTEIRPMDYYGGSRDFEQFCDDIAREMRVNADVARHDFLRDAVAGDGASADLMRYVFARKLNSVQAHAPTETVTDLCQDAIKRIVRQKINFGRGSLASTAGKRMFEEGIRGATVKLPGHVRLAADFETARDQLASFVTKGTKTRFADLSAGEKNQVYVAMSLLSKSTAQAAYDGPAIALSPLYDPEKNRVEEAKCPKAFDCHCTSNDETREIELDFDRDGGLVMSFRGSRNIDELKVRRDDDDSYASIALDTNGHVDGFRYHPASSMGSSFSLKIGADAFTRMGQADARGIQFESTDLVCREFRLSPTLRDRPPQPGSRPIRSIFPEPWTELKMPAPGKRDPIKFQKFKTAAGQLNSAIRLAEELDGAPMPMPELKPEIAAMLEQEEDGQ